MVRKVITVVNTLMMTTIKKTMILVTTLIKVVWLIPPLVIIVEIHRKTKNNPNLRKLLRKKSQRNSNLRIIKNLNVWRVTSKT